MARAPICSTRGRYGTTARGYRRTLHPDRGRHGARHARRLCLLGARHGPGQEPGQCAGEDHERLCRLDHRLLLRRVRRGLWRGLLLRRRDARRAQWLRLGQVLLSADLCRGHPGHRLRRDRRARQVLPPVAGLRPDRRAALSLLRGHRLERQLRCPGLGRGGLRRQVPRLRGFRRGSRRGRLDRAGGRVAAWPAPRALPRGRGHDRPPALVHPLSIPGGLDPHGGLVWVQRHVGPDRGCGERSGGGQLPDGDGRRHPGRTGGGKERPRLPAQRTPGWAGGGLRGLGSSCTPWAPWWSVR